jgi:predicted small secreted protein
MKRTALVTVALVSLAAAACTETVDGVVPVGGDDPSIAELERYVRRLHLDLTSKVPDEATSDGALAMLETEGNSATTRMSLADELLEDETFAETYVSELENRVFGGETLDGQYDFFCSVIRVSTAYPECNVCPGSMDPCANCDCYILQDLFAERAVLLASVDDLNSGARTTSEVERAYAEALIYRFTFGDAAAVSNSLFENFLGRPAEPEELQNASNMINGGLLGPDYPAGLLFHRHGTLYEDLVDIIFSDEAYREAMVDGVFQRYLGRPPAPNERNHFSAQLDSTNPDAKPIVRAVVSSREYFEQ